MCGACVCVYQLLNWKMHGETLKLFNICLPFVNNNLKSLRIVRLKNIYCCLFLLVWINTESMLRQKYEMHATGGYSSWRCSCVSSSSCSSLFLLFLLIPLVPPYSSCSSFSSSSSLPAPPLLVLRHYSAFCTLASHIIFLHSWWTLTIAYLLCIARVVILSICFIVNLYCFLNKLVFLHDSVVNSITRPLCHDKAETSLRE